MKWILQQTAKQEKVAVVSEKYRSSPHTGQVPNI